jgi:hypothetical protein
MLTAIRAKLNPGPAAFAAGSVGSGGSFGGVTMFVVSGDLKAFMTKIAVFETEFANPGITFGFLLLMMTAPLKAVEEGKFSRTGRCR